MLSPPYLSSRLLARPCSSATTSLICRAPSRQLLALAALRPAQPAGAAGSCTMAPVTPSATPPAERRTCCSLLARGASTAAVAAVNARFLRFRHALAIAALVGLLTLAAVAAIAWRLVTTCSLSCRSVPLALVPQSAASLSSLSCVGFKTRGLSLSVSPREQSREAFAPAASAPSSAWQAFAWTSPAATLGKCSFLHASSCGLQEWLAMSQGLAAIWRVSSGTASSAAGWPDTIMPYSSSLSLDNQISAARAAAANTSRLTEAGADALLAAGGATLGSARVTLLKAPASAACCDVTTSGSKLGTFGGNSSRYVINVLGNQALAVNTTSCTTNSSGGRCSWTQISVAMVVPSSAVINQHLCAEYFTPVNGSASWQVPADLSASLCQVLGATAAGDDHSRAPPLQLCLNGTISNVRLNLADFYTVSGACPAPPALPTAAAVARPWAAQQHAAALLLLPLAHEFGTGMALYMAQAQVDTQAAAQGLNAIRSDNEAASWWMENFLHCCSPSCGTWLASLGSALGYEGYVEGCIALVVIVAYLALRHDERLRLRELGGLRGITGVAFELQEQQGQQQQGDDGVAAATRACVRDGGSDEGIKPGVPWPQQRDGVAVVTAARAASGSSRAAAASSSDARSSAQLHLPGTAWA